MRPLSHGDPIRLGPYRLVGVLGEGGMGKVYLGRDNAGRSAAVKVLRPELAHDRHLAQRFVREAETARAVTSRGVAQVLDAQTEGGHPWIATEYLAGPTLDQAIAAHGPLDPPALHTLGSALASTLQDIHRAGLIHRDLKPSNVVLTSGGPRVIDFGIARPEHGLTLTTTGQIPVTPGYGAPEQVLGERVGPSADVFSLGAVLAHAASARPAYSGEHVAAVQFAVVHGSPDLRAVPPELRPLIEPCLARDPAQRPQPAAIAAAFAPPRDAHRVWKRGHLADRIKEHEALAEQFATLPGTTVGNARPSRRRFLASLAAGGTLLTLGGAGAAWWWAGGKSELPAAADAPPADLLTAVTLHESPRPLWGPLKVATPHAARMLPLRDVVMVAHPSGGLAAHKVTDGKHKWTLPEVSPSAGFLGLTEKIFVAGDESGNVLAFDASTSERRWSVPADAEKLLATAPGGGTVYLQTKDDRLSAVDVTSREVRWTRRVPAGAQLDSAAVGAAGPDHLVVCTGGGTYFAVGAETGKEAWTVEGNASIATAPAVGDGVVYMGGKALTAVDLASGEEVWSLASESLSSGADNWGPPTIDGSRLIAVDDGGGRVVDKVGGEVISRFWLDGTTPPRTPPVLQGNTYWVVEGGTSSGVSAFGKSSSEHRDMLVWTYESDRDESGSNGSGAEGPWYVAAAGNRVFLLHRGTLVALPVF
ncbi:hypothetical protein GCM10010271_17260 [Streptomyces kurssanovii]|nr:hypothetical protein GCM10010271_17260 [Streptomyces kurssanovii]